jgi:hypothetical protein
MDDDDDDDDDDDCRAVDGMIRKENRSIGGNLPQWRFAHHKYHMT